MFIGTSQDSRNVGVTLSINMPGGGYTSDVKDPATNGHTNKIGTLHAKTDASILKMIDPETLEPQGIAVQSSLHPDLIGEFSAARQVGPCHW
jgi:torulene dioxygenase